jgi:acetyltransferase-like isoleucine patch superfamily enzyme
MIIKREINKWLQAFFAQIPGGVGSLCRRVYFKLVLKKLGNGGSFGRGITITELSKISIGNDVILSDGCCLYANDGGEIQIGKSLHMNTNSCLAAANFIIV